MRSDWLVGINLLGHSTQPANGHGNISIVSNDSVHSFHSLAIPSQANLAAAAPFFVVAQGFFIWLICWFSIENMALVNHKIRVTEYLNVDATASNYEKIAI